MIASRVCWTQRRSRRVSILAAQGQGWRACFAIDVSGRHPDGWRPREGWPVGPLSTLSFLVASLLEFLMCLGLSRR